LWLSNSPLAHSGYGQQTAIFCRRLRDLGHEVSIAANYGVQAATLEWDGFPVYPAQGDWGNPVISTLAKHVRADWVITLCDSWVMKPDKWADDLRMAIWAPVDEYPIPPAVLATLQHPKVQPIAMSRFGEEWMRKFKLDPLYVPHGVDTANYRPQPEHKAAARRALSIPPDAFLVGMVGANRGWSMHACRKSFPQAFDAFARFAKRHEDAYLYVHTEATAPPPGIDLGVLAKASGCPEKRVAFPPEEAWVLGIMDNRFLAGVYSALDVLLNPSMSEGFGIPIIEAQACGVPVIVSNHSSMPELLGAGWLVEGDRWWDGAQMAYGIMPSVGSIEQALEDAYACRDDQAIRKSAVAFAQGYDADLIAETYWKPALAKLEQPREIPPLNGGESRQARRARERKLSKA
jgi:glycosyltransferase involved in cell wall biosynthesis